MGVVRQTTPVEVEIEALAAGGRGVARIDGRVWFVPGGLPGDRVLATPRIERRRFVEADLVRLVRASPDRRDAPCTFQQACGACPWMTLDDGVQRTWKRRLVQDALERIGGLAGIAVEPLLACENGMAYRNKVELALARDGAGRPLVGFHRVDEPREYVDVPRCAVQHDAANAVLGVARGLLLEPDAAWKNVFVRTDPCRLVIRRSWHTGEILVGVRETRPFPAFPRFARRLAERCPEVRGVVRLTARAGRRGGTRAEPVVGRSWIEERVGELSFRLPAASFLQIRSDMATELVRWIVESCRVLAGTEALDLYGGVGTIGLHLALRGARVVVCDADRGAVACGRRTARANGLDGATFVGADVGSFLESRSAARGEGELVVANPPRSGLGSGVADALLARRPRSLILVSCDPATLARDLRALTAGGYRVERVRPFDMFPQTSHVETVVLLGYGPTS